MTVPPGAWKPLLVLAVVLGGLYASGLSGRWVPGGGSDDAYYLAIGRNLAAGRGFTFDSTPVTAVPPGWPGLLAGAMRLSPAFAFLNLLPAALVLGAACLWYRVLLRFTTPVRSVGVCLLSGVLFEWHRFAWIHCSEALFFLLTAGCLLLAIQIAEGRDRPTRIALLLVLAAALVTVRWAGLLLLAPVGAAVLSGRPDRSRDAVGTDRVGLARRLLTVGLLVAVTGSAYVGLRQWTRHNARRISVESSESLDRVRAEDALRRDDRRSEAVLGQSPRQYLNRLAISGLWMGGLLLPPVRAGGSGELGAAFNVFGFALLALYACALPEAVRRRQWVWLGTACYCGALMALWDNPVPRYLAPLAPLLVLGIWRGVEIAVGPDRSPRRARTGRAVGGGLLLACGTVNLAILVLGAWVVRSGDFLDRCLAGEYRQVLGIAEFLNRRPGPGPRQIAVALRFADSHSRRRESWGYRPVSLLVGEPLLVAPPRLDARADRDEIIDWARRGGARYLLIRPREPARRLWHFRRPLLARHADAVPPRYYELLELHPDGAVPVDPPEVAAPPTRVPGL